MLCFVFAALVVILDQLFKYWISIELASGGQISILPGILNLIYVENSGAAFGIFADSRWPLVIVALICVVILVAVMLRYDGGFWGNLGLAAVLGGAVGNLVDRVFQGYVVDMFELGFMNFAIFNVADCFITVGGIIFCVNLLIRSFRERDEEEDSDFAENFDLDIDDDDVQIVPDPAARPAPVTPAPAAPVAQDTAPISPLPSYDIDDIIAESAADIDVSASRVLEEFDLERLLSEYDRDNAED